MTDNDKDPSTLLTRWKNTYATQDLNMISTRGESKVLIDLNLGKMVKLLTKRNFLRVDELFNYNVSICILTSIRIF